jgi:hypothetical protein
MCKLSIHVCIYLSSIGRFLILVHERVHHTLTMNRWSMAKDTSFWLIKWLYIINMSPWVCGQKRMSQNELHWGNMLYFAARHFLRHFAPPVSPFAIFSHKRSAPIESNTTIHLIWYFLWWWMACEDCTVVFFWRSGGRRWWDAGCWARDHDNEGAHFLTL